MATNKTTAKKKSTTKSKSRVGSTSLSRKKKSLLTPRNGLFAAIGLAVVGIVAVALSHASGTPAYQYSYSTACGSASSSSSQSCIDKSAEALVYRLYMGATGAAPSAERYAFWTQKLAGDRIRMSDASTLILASVTTTQPTSEKFVQTVYKNLLGRDSGTTSTWETRLTTTDKKKKMTRAQVLLAIANSPEAIKKNEDMFRAITNLGALKAATPVKVVPTALNQQVARRERAKRHAKAAATYAAHAKADMEIVKDRHAKSARAAAKPQGQITLSDLATAVKSVRDSKIYSEQALVNYSLALESANEVDKLDLEGKEVEKNSPDIKSNMLHMYASQTKISRDKAQVYVAGAKYEWDGAISATDSMKHKYDAEQARLAAIAAARARAAAEAAARAAAASHSDNGPSSGGRAPGGNPGSQGHPSPPPPGTSDYRAWCYASHGAFSTKTDISHGYVEYRWHWHYNPSGGANGCNVFLYNTSVWCSSGYNVVGFQCQSTAGGGGHPGPYPRPASCPSTPSPDREYRWNDTQYRKLWNDWDGTHWVCKPRHGSWHWNN